MIAEYEKEAEAEMKRLSDDPKTKGHTRVNAQVENMRSQIANYKQIKNQERMQHQAEVEICEAVISGIEARVGKVDE